LFSRRLPSTSTYTLHPPGASTSESNLDRLRRLRSEIEELEENVRREQEETLTTTDVGDVAAGEPGDVKGKKKEVSPAVILRQLQMLRGDLGATEKKIPGASTLEGEGENDGVGAESRLAEQAKASSSLLSKLGLGSSRTASIPEKALNPGPATSTKMDTSTGGRLEKRVADVEKALGASEAEVDEVCLLVFENSSLERD
jgi:nuclear migration protein JNM1